MKKADTKEKEKGGNENGETRSEEANEQNKADASESREGDGDYGKSESAAESRKGNKQGKEASIGAVEHVEGQSTQSAKDGHTYGGGASAERMPSKDINVLNAQAIMEMIMEQVKRVGLQHAFGPKMPDGGESLTMRAPESSIFKEKVRTDIARMNDKAVMETPIEDTFREAVTKVNLMFDFVDQIEPYVVYKKHATPLSSDDLMPYQDGDAAILADTLGVFEFGSAMIEIIHNPKLMNVFDLEHGEGVNFAKQGLKNPGDVLVSTDRSRYMMAQILLLYAFYNDVRIPQISGGSVVATSSVTRPLAALLGTKVQKYVGANPALLSVASGLPDWLAQCLEFSLDGDIYRVGQLQQRFDSELGIRFMNDYGMNIDHFTAAVLNANSHSLMMNPTTSGERVDQLMACCMRGTIIEAVRSTMMVVDHKRDRDVDERAMAFAMVTDSSITSRIQKANVDAISLFGVISILPKMRLYNEKITATGAGADLRNTLDGLAGEVDLNKVIELFAAEVTPTTALRTYSGVKELKLVHDQGMLLIWLIWMNINFRPNAFDSVKHLVQEQMLDFIALWLPDEYEIFIDTYGYFYIVEEGAKRFSQERDPLIEADYIGPKYPSLFANITFVGCPRITRLMTLLRPNGVLQQDVDYGNFPRLNKEPAHYNPYQPGVRGSTRDISVKYKRFTNLLLELLNLRASTRSSATIEQLRVWIEFTIDRMNQIFEGMNYVSDVMSVVQNLPQNCLMNFDGNFDTYKPFNFGLVGTRNTRTFIRDRGDELTYQSHFNLTDVLAIFGQLETPNMYQKGDAQIKVPIDVSTKFPDPLLLLAPGMEIVDDAIKVSAAYGFMTLVTSEEGLEVFPDLEVINENQETMPDSLYRQILEILAQRAGTSGESIAKVSLLQGGEQKLALNLGPVEIRRKRFGEWRDHDEAIDRPSLAESSFFMTALGRKRIDIGLKCLRNARLQRMRKGLRCCRMQRYQYNIDEIPDTQGFEEHVFLPGEDGTAASEYVNGMRRVGLRLNDVTYLEVNKLPERVHLIINNSREVPSIVRGVIDEAINSRGWIVDIMDAQYIVRLTSDIREMSDVNFMKILTAPYGHIHTVLRYETISWLWQNPTIAPPRHMMFETVFPLQTVSDGLSLRGLIYDQNGRQDYNLDPRRQEMDTGSIDNDGNVIYTDGRTRKLAINNEISMTNRVHVFTDSVENASRLVYKVRPPDRFPFAI
jgi:acetolactate synthase small subunit